MSEPSFLRKAGSLTVHYLKKSYEKYRNAPILGKAFFWFLIFFHILLFCLLFFVGPAAIAQTLFDWSQTLKKQPYGWLILASIIAITSFPPLIGWSTSVSVAGFAYGVQGWFLAAGGALVGAAMTFVVLRYLFAKRIHEWARHNTKWQAFENVIDARGLPLIILIRLSPLPPWVYANAMFASIRSVSFWKYMFATLCYTPKLMVAIWIGSRIAMFSDGETRGEMDTTAKIVNALSIVVSIAIGVGVGITVWRLTNKEIVKTTGHSLRDEEEALAQDAYQDAAENLEEPLLRGFSIDSNGRDSSSEPGLVERTLSPSPVPPEARPMNPRKQSKS